VARRALIAAAVLAALVAALLVAWGLAGWRDVRARQHELAAAPGVEAAQRAGELARDLRGQLERVLARESERPYFQYQNLMHDPRASLGGNVAPSPLASAPADPLVLGYFQIDPAGRVSTPTINDEVPELSDAQHAAADRAFREEVARVLAPALASPAASGPARVVEVDPSTYAQNASANEVYRQRPVVAAAAPVGIVVTAPVWQTRAFAGAPALIAVRHVDTPAGALVQGFVIDRATVTGWLAAHAGELVARIGPGEGDRGEELAPGWRLAVEPNPHAIARAAGEAHVVARDFAIRFVAIALFAVLAAAGVVWIVARAEKLARERSQFAAAAAHELRTPLAGLQLYGDMMADGLGDPDKLRDYARRTSEEAARLGRVVSNVLGFSQLERGNLSVGAQLGDLGTVLCELGERAQPALDRAGAPLEVDIDRELRARFDRDAVSRIVANLVDNAEKYARGADDRAIRIAARDRGDTVEIVVEDRGPGVADTRALFQPFSRQPVQDGPAGLGLGLALSRSLARAMGGELSYRARAGGGASFTLRLPRA
jgi:signal transduction histidine kinase